MRGDVVTQTKTKQAFLHEKITYHNFRNRLLNACSPSFGSFENLDYLIFDVFLCRLVFHMISSFDQFVRNQPIFDKLVSSFPSFGPILFSSVMNLFIYLPNSYNSICD